MFGHLTRAPLPAGPAHRQDQSAYPACCELAVRLYTPNLNNLGAKSPIVSALHLKYSRFWETRARDRARSALRGVGRSPNQVFLRKRKPQALNCPRRGKQKCRQRARKVA